MALIAALIDPEAYQGKVLELIKSTTYQDCMATITFNDDDLQLGSRLHNRPLYVSGYIRECKLHRIMIDCGSDVNIMPIKTMKKIGINVGDLSKSNIMIQGFNQKGQRAIGMIRLKLQIGELNSSTLFHVIDAKTSYELLLGRVWRYETGVVPSTWHQCFKYSRDGDVKSVVAESKPFLKEESYFVDAKFYSEDEDFYSVGLSTAGFEIKEDTNNDQRLIVVPPHQLMTGRSRITCEELSKGKQPQTTSIDVKVLRKELTFSISNIPKLALPYQLITVPETSKISTSIPSIEKLCISNSSKQNMPHVKEVEDMKQTFKDSSRSFIAQPNYGLGYNPSLPRKIKVKKVSSNPIMNQIYKTVEDKLKESRPSVFDRIQSENVRVSVFKRLERETSTIVNPRGRMSIFQRLSGDSSTSVQVDKDAQASLESFQRQSIFS
ncbi:Uncharacterized protein Adt_20888 [Abeliophyllum distichum]|uniref:Peptidase A2 domain-containing protein n=1 Tax=Abeliophyllum distichum TaxID=126358 RepID=A0ABD1SXU8_9LAMI